MDFSWSEMLIVGVVALIVIGPKDLPAMFRELGRITAKVRAMGRDFSRAMEQAAKETGVKEATDGLKAFTNPMSGGLGAVKSAADKFEKWDPLKPATTPAAPVSPPPMPPPMPPAAPVAATAPAGSATAALAEAVTAKKAAAAEKAGALRAAKASATAAPAATETPVGPAAAPEPVTPKRGGRVRKKPDAGAGDPA